MIPASAKAKETGCYDSIARTKFDCNSSNAGPRSRGYREKIIPEYPRAGIEQIIDNFSDIYAKVIIVYFFAIR